MSRMNGQTFSTGFTSGALGGRGTRVMLSGTAHLGEGLPSRPIKDQEGVCPGLPKAEARKITREEHEEARQVVAKSPAK